MKAFLQLLFYGMLFLAEGKASPIEKIAIFFKMLGAIAPIAYLLHLLNAWFYNNKQFIVFIIVAIAINMGVGIWRHYKLGTFKWESLLIKTTKMLGVLFTTYALLEMIRVTVGDNLLTDGFKVVIQIATIFYPASKALKSVFIISNGEYPPKWIMKKVYQFEKDGDVMEFFKKNNKNKDDI